MAQLKVGAELKDISMTQQQYISNLHDQYVNFINYVFSLADSLINLSQATDYDKQELDKVKLMLKSKGAESIEKELTYKNFSSSTLDKMEKLYKDLADFALEHIHENEIWKMFIKQLCYSSIEMGKKDALTRLEKIDIQTP